MMADLAMPQGDPAALEAAAEALSRYGTQTGDLAASVHKSTTAVVADGDWTGSAAEAYTAYTGGLVLGVGAMERPLSEVPGAVAGYAAALRTAQAKVGAYSSYAGQVSRFQGPVAPAAAHEAQTQLKKLETDARYALEGLEEAAQACSRKLTEIADALKEVFSVEGPFRKWLENIMRPWDAAGGDAILESVLKKGETAEKAFEKAEESAKAGKQFLADLPAALENKWNSILDSSVQDLLSGNADGALATDRFLQLKDAVETFSKDIGDDPAKSTLVKLLPGLKVLGGLTDFAGFIGGAYTAISPPEYDHGAMRWVSRVAGGAAAAGSGIGLLSSVGLIGSAPIASIAGASLTVPGLGEAVAVGAGLYFTGDFIAHHTHQIAHGFDVARHAAAHYADEALSGVKSAGNAISHGLSDITGGIL